MSVWTTRSLEKDCHYIVMQHALRGVNHTINGIKFREGYAVVEKDSKVYFTLKRIPVLRNAKEFPLSYLKKLPFITRTQDIRTVYGQDVYAKFLEELQKEQELQEQLAIEKREQEVKAKQELEKQLVDAKQANNEVLAEEIKANIPVLVKCSYRTPDGTLCESDALDYSPSGHCGHHLLEDPRIAEFGFEVPSFMTKEEKKAFRSRVKDGLRKAKSQGKF